MPTSHFTIFRNSDTNAPALNGQSGSLVSILDYVLVTGSGWIKSFSGTNSAVYHMPTGSGFYLNVQDTAITTSKEAQIWGYEVATAQNIGTNQFPSMSQGINNNGYLPVRKSSTADSTSRTWIVFADSMSFYFYNITGDSSATTTYLGWQFGDFYSFKSNDPYRCIIQGRTSENAIATNANALEILSLLNTTVTSVYVARSYLAGPNSNSLAVGKHGDGAKGSTTIMNGTTQYPNLPDNALYMSPVWITEPSTNTLRGQMRGFYQILHAQGRFSDGEQFTGSNSFVSKSFYILPGTNTGLYCMETSNTILTN
jgi:hypothetical protein